MDWLEILLKVATSDLENAAAIANMSVPYGIYIEDYSDLEQGAREIAHIDLIDEELRARDKSKAVIHIYFSASENFTEAQIYLREQFTAANIAFEMNTSNISESEWRDNWKKYFKVTEIGQKLVICPSWESYDNTQNKKVLTIDPGAAFGTGTHATTRLCLMFIEQLINGGSMLDIGCGSGILGIGAALLGAKRVVGVDIDATAVKVAWENAEINGVQDITQFIQGDLTDKVTGKFNIVCANIVADVIISLCDSVKDFMADDGLFLCSGIIDIRAEEVEKALNEKGFKILQHKVIDNWHAFAAKII